MNLFVKFVKFVDEDTRAYGSREWGVVGVYCFIGTTLLFLAGLLVCVYVTGWFNAPLGMLVGHGIVAALAFPSVAVVWSLKAIDADREKERAA